MITVEDALEQLEMLHEDAQKRVRKEQERKSPRKDAADQKAWFVACFERERDALQMAIDALTRESNEQAREIASLEALYRC